MGSWAVHIKQGHASSGKEAEKEMTDRWSLKLMREYGEKMRAVRDRDGPTGIARGILGQAEQMGDELSAESAQSIGIHARLCADWADCGFPSIRCGPRLGESMMTSKIPGSALPENLAPWETMLLELPTNTLVAHELTTRNGWVEREYYNWIIVQNKPAPDLHAHLEKGIMATHLNWLVWPVSSAMGIHAPIGSRSMAEMAEQAQKLEVTAGDYLGRRRPEESRDIGVDKEAVSSTGGMLLSFVIGCLLEVNSRQNTAALRRHKKIGPVQKRNQDRPREWVFKLTRPVVVDCREFVKTASEHGTRCALTVQRLVRGHWKNQACGAGRSDRRFIHVEPYWRGPEDAPIAVSPHILPDREDDAAE